ncbi:nucleotidyltransferase family protein [Paenibacillus harenae]|uniref:nucleotidyltransferase family protein n=1 Tax=Paenibacillus harenae TaxID=306543 RepID=UPI0027D8D52C|nr:NTP transferase domain-containing protein [Paenibacillus harenae]
MGRRKQELVLMPGIALGRMALHALLQCSVEEAVIVVHPSDPLNWAPEEELSMRSQHFRHKGAPSIRMIRCERADEGMAYSLRKGLTALLSGRSDAKLVPDAILVLLADQPFVDRKHIERLLSRFREQPHLDYVASVPGDAEDFPLTLMPPAILSRTMYEAIEELEGDEGARKLFANARFHGEFVSAVSDEVLLDVDNQVDLELAIELCKSIRP